MLASRVIKAGRIGRIMMLPLLLALTGCVTWPDRIPRSEAQAEAAQVLGFSSIRMWADAPPEIFVAMREEMAEQTASEQPYTLLALSGGADDGAYGAGFLKGWSDSGKRPKFTIVSGVSTGALIAPFAFLGSDYDHKLRAFYTEVSRDDIYRQRGIVGLLTQPSVANSTPLRRLIAANVDERLLAEIAEEHAQGRRLFVQTTNLDASRGVIWNMGAIAQSKDPGRLELFREVLLASASVPGLFAPVMIHVSDGNASFAEMHVDGAASADFFAVPALIARSGETQPVLERSRIFIIINGRLRPRYETVDPSTISIIERALTSVLSAYDRASLANTQTFAAEKDIDFAVSAVGNGFDEETNELFSAPYMNALYEYGVSRGSSATWFPSLEAAAQDE